MHVVGIVGMVWYGMGGGKWDPLESDIGQIGKQDPALPYQVPRAYRRALKGFAQVRLVSYTQSVTTEVQ